MPSIDPPAAVLAWKISTEIANTAGVRIGGGNGDTINWSKTLAFGDGTGASGTWGISVTGNAGTVTNGVYTTGDQNISGKKVMTPTVATGASTEQAFRINPNALAGSPEWRNMFNIQSTYNAGSNGHGFYIKANASNQFEIVTDWSTNLRLGVITNAGSAANATAAKYLNLTTAAITWDGNALLDAANYTTYTVTKTGTGASGTWGISVTGNAGTATTLQTGRAINAVTFNGSADITVPRVRALDDRTLAPADGSANYVTAYFTSWANNNTSPYADALLFRTWADGSGGNDNLVTFRKDANEIGFENFLNTIEQTQPLTFSALINKKLELI